MPDVDSDGTPELVSGVETPPIPVPDVPGADATARGLPRRIDLTLRQRLIVDSSAVADLALRTSIATLIGATMVPTVAGAGLVAACQPGGRMDRTAMSETSGSTAASRPSTRRCATSGAASNATT